MIVSQGSSRIPFTRASAVRKTMITEAELDSPPMGSVPSITPLSPTRSGNFSFSCLAAPRQWSAQSPALLSGICAAWNCARFPGKLMLCSSMTPFIFGL